MTRPVHAPQAFWGWIDHTLTGGSGVGPIAASRGWSSTDAERRYADTRHGIGPEVSSSRARSVVVTPEGRTLALYRTSDEAARVGGEFIHVVDVSAVVADGSWDPMMVASSAWQDGLFLRRTEAMRVVDGAGTRDALDDLALTEGLLSARPSDKNLHSVRAKPPFDPAQLATILGVILARLDNASSVGTACVIVDDRRSAVPHLVQILDHLPAALRAHVTFTTELRGWVPGESGPAFALAPGRVPGGAPAPVVDLTGGATAGPSLPGWALRVAQAIVATGPTALPECPGASTSQRLRTLFEWVLSLEIETTPSDAWSAAHLRFALDDAPGSSPGTPGARNGYWRATVAERLDLVERLSGGDSRGRDLLDLARDRDPELNEHILLREVSSGDVPLDRLPRYLRVDESTAGPDELARLITGSGARLGNPAFSPDDARVLATWIARCMRAGGAPDDEVVMGLADRDHSALLEHLPEHGLIALVAHAALEARADRLVNAVLADPRSGPALVSHLERAGGPSYRVSVELAQRLDGEGLRTVVAEIVHGSDAGLEDLWLWCDDLIAAGGRESFLAVFPGIARDYLAMPSRCVDVLVPHPAPVPEHERDRNSSTRRQAEYQGRTRDTLTLPPERHDVPREPKPTFMQRMRDHLGRRDT